VVGAVVGAVGGHEAAEALDPTVETNYWRQNYNTRPYYKQGKAFGDYEAGVGSFGGARMKVLVDLSVVPLGVGLSLSRYVAECERVLKEAGLKTALHANGTNIEGEWDEVFAAVRRCHEVLHDMGVPRVSATLRVGTRTDKVQSLEDKVRSVEEKMK
jgi:uncharacterized protein (TIGR00106 family)